jgi:hypothetical protein
MKSYTKKQFLADVTAEVKAIKKMATSKEIERLDFETFNPKLPRFCIYGQLTGYCRNKRANKLIKSCCKREIIIDYLDLSPLENYITYSGSKNKMIIDYLKGDIKTLKL